MILLADNEGMVLRCSHMLEDTFSHDAIHVNY